ncbi:MULTISPECIES: redoxin domain-containing protein [Micromonospora]|uniref:Redoxin n=1 Tax=Micromonospora solifontis TaxID=2487138 RepID=A0ABX9WLC5_9ACTN|nr:MULTISPECIES: redoxin domain-containing protein [Micromonospora]NES13774.1 redoxin domain-containing protein [Micromonospora sp. PPF5-17B]NES35565.1 redoxin domain-containing protein [Micromonospora solifontis]NES55949.1 redoxin domain-containing protein [Micromonospora sp. PPF5-6]RNM00619.1 redoxin [Micromonospora solifontis]
MIARLPPLTVRRWVNSPPLTPDDLRGRVVLIDVWEYTCVNWIRTAPFVKAWHRDYADLGLTVIGVHAPEFQFGRQPGNVDQAVRDHRLTYPVALDDDFTFWRALGNAAWPAKYLFNADGRFVERWIGEGDYDRVESEIRRLLEIRAPGTRLPPVSAEVTAFAGTGEPSYLGITPETYLGAERAEPGTYALTGDWRRSGEYVEVSQGGGELVLPFNAGEVNLVVDPGPAGPAAIRVLLDGNAVDGERGGDVGPDAVARIDRPRMVRLVAGASRTDHELTLVVDQPGFRAYVFTFGP